jgi:hypothetical protein
MEKEHSKQHNVFNIYFNIIFPSSHRSIEQISSHQVFRLQICTHFSYLPSHPTCRWPHNFYLVNSAK